MILSLKIRPCKRRCQAMTRGASCYVAEHNEYCNFLEGLEIQPCLNSTFGMNPRQLLFKIQLPTTKAATLVIPPSIHDFGLTRSAAIAALSFVRPAFASLRVPTREGSPMPSHGMSQSFSGYELRRQGEKLKNTQRGYVCWVGYGPPQQACPSHLLCTPEPRNATVT